MDTAKCEAFCYVLDVISSIKKLYDEGDVEVAETLECCPLDDEFEFEGYQHLCEAAPFADMEYIEDMDCEKYFFSSEAMTEYYRLAKKIGRLKGWSEKNNPYIRAACDYDMTMLDGISNGEISGVLYMGTKHKYASSWIMHIYSGFFDYWNLFFALRDIFNHYENEKAALEMVYERLTAQNETEVAA